MRLHSRNIVKFVFILLFVQQLRAQENSTNFQKITQDEIKSAGIINIADIVTLADRNNFYTIDGFQNYNSIGSTANYNRQGFTIFLNNQKFESNIFEVNDLNLIPISIDQIDSVIFVYEPTQLNGVFASQGAICFYTKNQAKGFSVNAAYIVANETGDPGPNQFTDYATPNVDKLNFINSATLAGAGDSWSLTGNFKLEENFITDQAIKKRITSFSPENNKASLKSGGIFFDFDFMGRKQNLIFGYSEKYDFFFFKPFGNEIPAKRIVSHTGLKGGVPISNLIDINYNFLVSKNELNEWENIGDIKFNFGQNNYFGSISANLRWKNFAWDFGLNYNEYIAHADSTLINSKVMFTELFTKFKFNLTRNSKINFNGLLRKYNKDQSFKLNFYSEYDFQKVGQVSLSASLETLLPEERLDLWLWIDRGYKSNVISHLDYFYQNEPRTGKQFSVDLSYQRNSATYGFDIGVGYRGANNTLLTEQLFQYYSNSAQIYSPIYINFQGGYENLILHSSFNFTLFNKLKNKFTYLFNKSVYASSSLAKDVWPAHVFTYQIGYKPVDNFGIWGKIKYISSTFWDEFKYIENQSNNYYSSKNNSIWLVEASIEKWFWNRRIWTNLLFRNLSNNVERYHPIGAAIDLRFIFQVHVYLNSIFM